MHPEAGFEIDAAHDLRVVPLTAADEARLQLLYDACADFTMLVDGQPPAPDAAAADLAALPPGARPEDKQVFGLADASGHILGMIESIRGYPRPGAWWLGLMLIDPRRRRDGLGSAFYAGFERWVQGLGGREIALGVVAANTTGMAFWSSLGFAPVRVVEAQTFGRLTHDVHVLGKAFG